MNLLKRANRKGDKIFYYYDLGRGQGQRPSTGIFVYAHPKNQIQKNHNVEALRLIEVKKSQATIEAQSIGSPFIPQHRLKANFLDYYRQYVIEHKSKDNRHLPCSFEKFKLFVGKDFISPIEITEDFCKRFRKYLLDHLAGETPQNYFSRFKWVVNAATKEKYFIDNPVESVSAIAKPSLTLKEIIETDEYFALLSTPSHNQEVSSAFIFCLYTGLRWIDVSLLSWHDIKDKSLTTRLIQHKTGHPVIITLHPVAQRILEEQKNKSINRDLVFSLPSANGANKMLGLWALDAGIDKKITWSCARLSFSVLLQDQNVDAATVAYLLGHATTKQVLKTYRRQRPKDQWETINKLPFTEELRRY